MRQDSVRTAEDALSYLLDCSLATVEDMAMKKNPPKGEFTRQIAIAQTNLDWAVMFGSNLSGTRGQDIVDAKQTVVEYAAALRSKM